MNKLIITTILTAVVILAGGAWWYTISNKVEPIQYTTIRIGVDAPYPPYEYYNEKGELTGFEIELGNAVCEHVGVSCEWIVTPWDTIIDDLNAGKFDMIMSSMSIDADRKKLVSFSDPYYSTPSVFFTRKGEFIKGISNSDLNNQKIAVQSGTLQHKYLQEKYDDIQIMTFDGWDAISASFRAGESDVVFTDYPQWEGEFMLEGVYEVIGKPIQFNGIGLAFRKADVNLRKAMNKGLDYTKTYGEFQRLRRKYFFYDIMVN